MTKKNGTEAGKLTYRFLIGNMVTRGALNFFSDYCEDDGGNRLEVALDLIVSAREKSCRSCHLASIVLRALLRFSYRNFGIDEEQLKMRLGNPYWRRGLTNVLEGLAWFGVKRPFVPGAPFQVVWNVTGACNLKCKHCYANAGSIGHNEMSTNDALRAIDILADAGVLILAFSGGEPILRPDIIQLMKHTHDRGVYVAAATNAMFFSSREKVKEFKQNGLEFVQVSLDGKDSNSHDTFRGVSGSYAKTVEGIKNCVAEGLFVEVATTVTRYNYEEIPAIIDLAEQLKANWFMAYNFVPTGRGANIAGFDLSPDEREELLKMLWHSMKTKKINVLSTAPQFARVAQESEEKLRESSQMSNKDGRIIPTHFCNSILSGDLIRLADFIGGCGAGRFYISIEPNGDIYPCVFFPRDDESKLGNILEVDFEDMWRHSGLLQKLRNKDILDPKCGLCEYRYVCGGCRARAYSYFGDILAPDPGCMNNKEYWLNLRNHIAPDVLRPLHLYLRQ